MTWRRIWGLDSPNGSIRVVRRLHFDLWPQDYESEQLLRVETIAAWSTGFTNEVMRGLGCAKLPCDISFMLWVNSDSNNASSTMNGACHHLATPLTYTCVPKTGFARPRAILLPSAPIITLRTPTATSSTTSASPTLAATTSQLPSSSGRCR